MNETMLNEVQSDMIAILGKKVWNRLQTETQIDVMTSEMCFRNFKEIGTGVDFSSVINPIMKGLENELKINFYDGYMHFLNQNYVPEKYIQSIWGHDYPKEKAASMRLKILSYSNNILRYQTRKEEFTLGNFAPSISHRKWTTYHIDKPFEDYCIRALFSNYQVSHSELEKWILDLIVDIESLRKLRNESAHAGKIQVKRDAETAINDLVKVKKILGTIVSPPWVI